MSIRLPEKCLRDRSDCCPLSQICEDDGDGFICCGLNDENSRTEIQDIFRHCWKTDNIDEMTDWDKRDIIDTISVLSKALSIRENIHYTIKEELKRDEI